MRSVQGFSERMALHNEIKFRFVYTDQNIGFVFGNRALMSLNVKAWVCKSSSV